MGSRSTRMFRAAFTAAVVVSMIAAVPVAAAKPDGAGGGKPGGGGGGGGKPGYPDRIVWRGVEWQINTSNAAVGPGPCVEVTVESFVFTP